MSLPGHERIGSLLRGLDARIASLEAESAALREQLEASGHLDARRLEQLVHKKRFDSALRRSPCKTWAGFSDVLQHKAIVEALASFAGSSDVAHVGCRAPPEAQQESEPCRPATTLYVLGGNNGAKTLSSCEQLRPESTGWEAMPPMSQARDAAAAAVVAGEIYVCGGNDSGQTLNRVEVFSPQHSEWRMVASMLTSRSGAGAAESDGRLYVCGGWDGKQALATGEWYDPKLERWRLLPTFMANRREWPVVTADSSSLYVCGGQNGSVSVDAVELYDLSTQKWETCPIKLECRQNASVVVWDNLLYICGGQRPNGRRMDVVNAVDRFNPHTNEFEALAPMRTYRRNSMAMVAAGFIYIVGGCGRNREGNAQGGGGGGRVLQDAERFNVKAGVWENLPPLETRRYRAACATLSLSA